MYVCVYILCVTGLLFVKGDSGEIGASIFSLLCGYVFVGKESLPAGQLLRSRLDGPWEESLPSCREMGVREDISA